MRYIVSIAAAFLVLIILEAMTGFGEWPRPWGPLSRGAVGGAVAIAVLIVWEQMSPRPDSLRDDERAALDAEDAAGAPDADTPDAEDAAGSEAGAGSQFEAPRDSEAADSSESHGPESHNTGSHDIDSLDDEGETR